MTLKKTISLLLSMVLLLGMIHPCLPVFGTGGDHIHTYGDWSFDTEAGTQSRSCSQCGDVQTLYGTDTKVSQAEAPAVGETYYLAANVAGQVQFFLQDGSVTDTKPYSLHTTTDVSNTKVKQVTLEAPVEGSTGFQLTFDHNGTLTRIYCYDVLTTSGNSGIMDTGTNTAKYLNRHTFFVDEVNGVQVLRKIGNNNILVVKYNTTTNEYRMLGVPESELANDGVYPAMLVTVHTHSYSQEYAYDEDNHWHTCDCGAASQEEPHSFQMDETLGYEVCVCGADLKPHECENTDGIWHIEGDSHYLVCDECGEPLQQGSHTYGDWTFDTEKGTQSRVCTVCQHTQTLYGTDQKVLQAQDPGIGDSYYLAANANGTVYYFVLEGSVTATKPYSLVLTTNLENTNLRQVTLETPVSGEDGFQITFLRASDNKLLRIYCYDAGGSDGIMDTGTNAGSEYAKHTFYLDEVDGVQVIRKTGNDHILAIKYFEATGTYRMLGVPESELANEGVYPAMLVENHTHSFEGAYGFDSTGHWQSCQCGSHSPVESHDFQLDETLGYEVCICGANLEPHRCESEDGTWYVDGDNHYQLCTGCSQPIHTAAHTYGDWVFDTENGTQSRECTVCQHAQTLHGTGNKVIQAESPAAGDSYYLVANAKGTVYYFVMEGSVTATKPYSLALTTNLENTNLRQVTLEAPVSGDDGFQITFLRASDNKLLRIYCYDAGGSDGIMDTGTNAGSEFAKHTFCLDEVDGVQVLRKSVNDHILAVKYFEATGTYRMLGVPESELANEGVYPAMLVENHTHSFSQDYTYDVTGHWHSCSCGSNTQLEPHDYVMDEALGYEVCICGADLKDHVCANTDGIWHQAQEGHYQLCNGCLRIFREESHSYGDWVFDTENGTQSRQCEKCGYVQLLWGAEIEKVSPVEDPQAGQSYYLAANAGGKLYFFRHGQVTDTNPCSLWVTEDLHHSWTFPVTVEAPVEGKVGFQLKYSNPATDSDIRIYCYDSVGSDGVMDTGTNGTCEYLKHTFYLDEVDGVPVLRKTGNNYILAVKLMESTGTYRMLGVPESELANEGVYPAMLVAVHQHTSTDTTYHSDGLGHWFACECGGKCDYAEHTVRSWTYSVKPTTTTPGTKTGECIVCGGTAQVELPPMVADGYYHLTGTLGGVKYYFRDQAGQESVEDTVPFSLLATNQKQSAVQVNILWDEKANTYVLSYFRNRQLNIYMGDVNGSTVAKDGKVDLASSGTTSESLITFYWDPVAERFYQIEDGQRYVIAFRKMTLTDGVTQMVRMLAVPESELDENTVAMQLEAVHIHSYSESWSHDAVYHWQECSCGTRKNEAAHTIEQWNIEREATEYAAGKKSGVCSFCQQTIVQAIPIINDNVQPPANGAEYYLTGVVNGCSYYFRHAASGVSVTDTSPYSLYTVSEGKANKVTVVTNGDKYNLVYGTKDYHIYINGSGVGVTTKTSADLVDFSWDEENKLLYQEENGVKCVLVFRVMWNSKTGSNQVRITFMPMDEALIDPTVAIVRFTTVAPPEKEKETVEIPGLMLPEGATALKHLSDEAPATQTPALDDAISPRNPLSEDQQKADGASMNMVLSVVIIAVVLALVIALALLKNTKFGIGFFGNWNLWTAAAFVIAAIVLVVGMLLPGAAEQEQISLAEFTIVANAGNLDAAEELAVTIYEKHGVSLPVVQSKDYQGNMGIYLDTQGVNSYGGYKYSIYSENDEYGPGIYINGSGPSLETAISKWLKELKDPYAFPFGLQESISGYEWNTGDINMTGLGFSLTESQSTQLCQGVELREMKYQSFGYGKVTGYAVIVDSDADVELKVAAGQWDENTTTDNPGTKYTVGEYGKMLTEDGYEVLAITNAGFYDLNTTMTYIPWGMQIVDGYVRKTPNQDNPNNTDNWFGQTADGKYVISNTEEYFETYETTLAQGVGGGRVLMRDGVPCFTTTGADYRTVVGITKGGDLVMLTVPSANYAFIAQIFMDMDVDIDCVLNLDGGGSTTMHSLNENGNLTQLICETPIERQVADAIAIVKKN